MHICREKYRLELHWDSLEYHSDTVINLTNARFSGPVLKDALKLEAPDSIELDFTPQLLTLMDSYYIMTLDWATCTYTSDGVINLTGATLSNKFLKTLHKLEDKDYVVINTEKHEEATHAFHLVYESQVVRETAEPHNYRNK
jgi:hypothetical protein